MKIGILTYHTAYNFGAQLQAYALHAVLREMAEAEIVNYAPLFIARTYAYVPYYADVQRRFRLHWQMPFQAVKRLPSLPGYLKYRYAMAHFAKEHLQIKAPPLKRPKDFAGLPYDRYILGSDQIWNPDFGNGFDPVYFGQIPKKEGCKCISYAASFGRADLAENRLGEFTDLLRQVDVISVRESSAVPFVGKCAEKPVYAMPDPVFLLKQHHWQALAAPPAIQGKYILIYRTEQNPRLYDYAQQLAQQYRCLALEPGTYRKPHFPQHYTLPGAGPREFLGLVQNARAIVTNSFHGMALSILFQKDFCIIPHSSLNARLDDVLKELGLQQRNVDVYADCHKEKINWNDVVVGLSALRERGIGFLKEALT